MTLIKACFWPSNRIGTLIFLCLFMMSYLWGIISYYLDFTDPIFKQFLKENGVIYLVNIIIMMIGFLIFLATAVCIIFNRPIILLLNSAIAFLPSKMISNIYTVLIRFKAEFNNTFDAVFEKKTQNLSSLMRSEFRIELKNHYETQLNIVYYMFAIDFLTVLLAVLVLYGYKTELKKKFVVEPASINFNDKKAKFTEYLLEKFRSTAPQYSLLPTPTQYSSQASLSTIIIE